MGDVADSNAPPGHQLRDNDSKVAPYRKRTGYVASRSQSAHSLLSARQLLICDSETSMTEQPSCSSILKQQEDNCGPTALSKQGSFVIFQHLQRHGSSFGLQTWPELNDEKHKLSDSQSTIIEIENEKETKPHAVHNSASLSWKKLQMLKPKLKAASGTSALMAGFAMAAVVELQLSTNQIGELPAPLLISLSLCSSLLVAVHMMVLLISTCIFPSMEGISNLRSLHLVNESPHEKVKSYIEFAWICSTVLGIVLFMLEVTIVCWVQFYNVLTAAAYVATAVFVVFIFNFIWFAVIFYRIVVTHTYENRQVDIKNLEEMRSQIAEC